MVIDTGSHWLRPLRVWLGEVDEVVAALGHPHPDMEGESLCRALLRFESGTVATFDAMLTTGAIANQPLFTVTGTQGRAHGGRLGLGEAATTAPTGRARRSASRAATCSRTRPSSPTSPARCCTARRPPRRAEYAVGELRLALAMYRSAETKQWEKVWS